MINIYYINKLVSNNYYNVVTIRNENILDTKKGLCILIYNL